MKTILVKELMVPVESYATVSLDATLYEAIITLEIAQESLDPSQYKHRAVLVLDNGGKVLGKLTMKDILTALEPKYSTVGGSEVLSRSGHSPELIKSMLEDNVLWHEPFEFVCERASQMKVGDFVKTPEVQELIDENVTFGEAIHQLLTLPYIALLVKRDDEIIGILRLSDVFATICNEIKTCEF